MIMLSPPLPLEANRVTGIVALSRGRGDHQDRRDRQADPTKHAHRNLVHVGAIEPEANNPREV
jgi:hypothetical protein